MYIRRVPHKNTKTRKEYHTYKLVDSIRTERGPRQRDILNLGVSFDLPKEQWKDLANCIEGIITGQKPLFDYPEEIRKVIYTTNAIESLNSVIRKAIKNRKIFPHDNSALKVTWLAIQAASKKWTMPLHHWNVALNRFMIEYQGRLPRGY